MSVAKREALQHQFELEDRFEALVDYNPNCLGVTDQEADWHALRALGLRIPFGRQPIAVLQPSVRS